MQIKNSLKHGTGQIMDKDLFYKKINFFKNGKFRINLAYDEIENKILFPGHRFIPFLNPEINPNSISIYNSKGKQLKARTVSINPERIKQFYSIYGLENFLFLLIRDIEENSSLILEETKTPKKFMVTVFSLDSIFEDSREKIKNNKYTLEMKIEDWEKGIYTADFTDDSEERDDIHVWVENLEKGLLRAEEYKSGTHSIEDYLSTAFYLGGEYLIKNPAVTLEEFQVFSEKNFISIFHSKSETSRILEKSKQELNGKINSLIRTLLSIENRISGGEIDKDREKNITLDKISNTISTLRAFSSELDSPDINEEKLNIIIQIINDSEKLTRI